MRRLAYWAFAAVLGAGPAAAAPQVLGLVASREPIPFYCEGGLCSVYLSAFCLQRSRSIPRYGTPYAPAAAGIVLVAASATGELRLPAEAYLRFASYRDFTAVKAVVAEDALAALGARPIALEVGPAAALLPVARPGDPDPQSPDEIALATGPMRQAAARHFDAGGADADAARLVNAMINALPDRGRTLGEDFGDVWRKAVGGKALNAADPAGVALARTIYERCEGFGLRRCLEWRHDDLMLRTNWRHWDAAGGS